MLISQRFTQGELSKLEKISKLIFNLFSGIVTGIYNTNSIEACFHVLKSSRANLVIVDDANQMEKIRQLKGKLNDLRAVVQVSESETSSMKRDEGFWKWKELFSFDLSDVEKEFANRSMEIKPNECCAICFTSGTTGLAKGAMISHDNLTWVAKSVSKRLEISPESKEVIMSYLPLSHMAGQVIDVFLSMKVAATVYFAEKDAIKNSFLETLVEVRPTLFIGVPRIHEKVQGKMIELEKSSSALKSFFDSQAKKISSNFYHSNQEKPPFLLKLARAFILNEKKTFLGLDRCKNLITAAAPMTHETKNFFLSLDLPIRELSGMTELPTHCISDANLLAFTSVGRGLEGTQTKIVDPDENDQGEIAAKGRNVFMGYIGDIAKTCETIDDDGWLHTGDFGRIDESGNVFITGRLKEIIITSGGENIAPLHVENLVKSECAAISNAVLVGDQRKYLVILLTLKTEMDVNGAPLDDLCDETQIWLKSLGVNSNSLREILFESKVLAAIQEAIDRANEKSISKVQRVQKFAILPQDFSVVTGEFGPSLKLKRNFVHDKYKNVIDSMY